PAPTRYTLLVSRITGPPARPGGLWRLPKSGGTRSGFCSAAPDVPVRVHWRRDLPRVAAAALASLLALRRPAGTAGYHGGRLGRRREDQRCSGSSPGAARGRRQVAGEWPSLLVTVRQIER